ncbi:carotenoid ester lipase precursor [Epithele typhae]|uniref:carotenoid ester lipase precursor n=1 Tax=Epithele typhae TaxID=378194 RepID=UPI0020080D20|nr:carotenoid ester lipase precursor [Epithele typhae]KAH9910175.1 carotenoid ester lipase precursor [Epithele typhae]
MPSIRVSCSLLLLAATALAVPADRLEKRAPPTVTLDQGTFVGEADGDVNNFLGIPFGKPPTEDLRFNLPVAVDAYTGTHNVTAYGPSCPQQAQTQQSLAELPSDVVDYANTTVFASIESADEDCLSLNVIVPNGAKIGDDLPVAVWVFGGGFQVGGSSMAKGGVVVKRSIAMNEPTIFVSMNYRVSAYGFLASKEVKEAGVGNLGLQDQRLALHWVQKYISQFGGDPSKVTIWGASAGAISVALHMVTNGGDTEGLFRGAFMQSGSPIPVGDIEHGQSDYDAIVNQTGCQGAPDTLQCLRNVDFDVLKKAVDASPSILSYQSLRLAWLPRVDGVFLTDAPQQLVLDGSVADVPFVSGDCDDEGTLFSLGSRNVTTDDQFAQYVKEIYVPDITDAELDALLSAYPSDVTQGSPFDTGDRNAITPQFKRIAAFQGDLVFNAARRFFIQQRADDQPVYSFLSKRFKWVPTLGSVHGSDLVNVFGPAELTDYLINFANNLNPNGATITMDDFRNESMAYAVELALKYPL